MALKINWSPAAIADLQSTAESLAKTSVAFTKTVLSKLFSSARNLGTFPAMGKPVAGSGDEAVKEIVVYNHRLIYRVEQFQILVLAVIPGKT